MATKTIENCRICSCNNGDNNEGKCEGTISKCKKIKLLSKPIIGDNIEPDIEMGKDEGVCNHECRYDEKAQKHALHCLESGYRNSHE